MSIGPIQGLAYFPGINQLVRASMALSHGITPSTCVLTIAPQADFAGTGGTLRFLYGSVEIDLADCKVDRHSFERNASGLIWRLSIFDRRWKWAFGGIAGYYNQRNDDGSIKDGTEMSPQELAALLLDAMGESDYDVADLPNQQRPPTHWQLGRLAPAHYLADLCEQLGCWVVLEIFTGRVAIRRKGVGQDLPQDDTILDNSLTIDPPEQPDTLSIACGPDRFQNDWSLSAVALETDETLVPVDEVSYKPAGGWQVSDFPSFLSVDQDHRDRAVASVYRYFQIEVPDTIADVPFQVTTLDQVLPIEDVQVETSSKIDAGGNELISSKPAAVYGSWFVDGPGSLLRNTIHIDDIDPNAFENTPAEYKQPFRIDRRRGLVIFPQPVFANAEDDGDDPPQRLTITAPALYLRVACAVRDPDTFAPIKYTRDRLQSDEFDTPTRYIGRDEIALTHVPTYNADFEIQSVTDNRDDVNLECDYYLDAAQQEYQETYPQTIKYIGLRDDIELDGAILQVELNISQAGTTMTASRNDEQVHKYLSFKERRLRENAAKVNQLLKGGRMKAEG